jgi:transposase
MSTKHRRDFAALEERRRMAMKLLQAGHSQAEVARRLDVSRASVCRWNQLRQANGPKAWKAKTLGRPARLDSQQRAQLLQFLLRGAQAHGFLGDLWTIPRMSKVVERHFGVRLHDTQVWRIMRDLGWTPQKPERRALERDEASIRRWRKHTWPALKKRPSPNGG